MGHYLVTLEDLGYGQEMENFRIRSGYDSLEVGRITAEHRERYVVRTAEREYEAEILGNLRYTAQSRSDFPAVGDWVAFSGHDQDHGLIHCVFPRTSVLERQSVSIKGEKQIIAANIDAAFVVQAVDRDFSINRLERYLTICHSARIEPIIVLSKTDTVEVTDLRKMTEDIRRRITNVPVFPISNKTQQGIEGLKQRIEKGRTYCLLGSSGAGKSTLLNVLSGQQIMSTTEISQHSGRGRHATTHRELHVLENGGILIDNPGMREVGVADSSEGLDRTFKKIPELAGECRFKDCTHTVEQGCAVMEAVEQGKIDRSSYENYLKMGREKEHFESTVAEKRRKDKDFGKMVKEFKKSRKSGKY